MSRPRPSRGKQLVDWSAALWAGWMAGAVFLGLNVVLTPLLVGGNAWVIVRLFASVVLGPGILAPPATFHLGALVAALAVHFALSLLFALLVAYLLHRGGLIVGVVGGALFGLALYFINLYSLTYFFPWFFAMRSGVLVATHVLFGAMAGGIYEALEVEEFADGEDAAAEVPGA
ncbi:MAG: hypothetical protein DHS20C21_15720 [Gemmatimonadota bacterium]|nr:MAG: hypothetical protein DHS20C21_15720 [Gemmatimonadota bacterium]